MSVSFDKQNLMCDSFRTGHWRDVALPLLADIERKVGRSRPSHAAKSAAVCAVRAFIRRFSPVCVLLQHLSVLSSSWIESLVLLAQGRPSEFTLDALEDAEQALRHAEIITKVGVPVSIASWL